MPGKEKSKALDGRDDCKSTDSRLSQVNAFSPRGNQVLEVGIVQMKIEVRRIER